MIKIGDVFSIQMDESNGITPKDGYPTRRKFFVVLGFDNEGYVYGGVVINSHVNYNLPDNIIDYQMPIKASKYSFLRYDSFVNCSKLKVATVEAISSSKLLGSIKSEDLNLIIGTVCESPNESKIQLRRFGLLKS